MPSFFCAAFHRIRLPGCTFALFPTHLPPAHAFGELIGTKTADKTPSKPISNGRLVPSRPIVSDVCTDVCRMNKLFVFIFMLQRFLCPCSPLSVGVFPVKKNARVPGFFHLGSIVFPCTSFSSFPYLTLLVELVRNANSGNGIVVISSSSSPPTTTTSSASSSS